MKFYFSVALVWAIKAAESAVSRVNDAAFKLERGIIRRRRRARAKAAEQAYAKVQAGIELAEKDADGIYQVALIARQRAVKLQLSRLDDMRKMTALLGD